jgi:hydroxyacyl-ACP dehydratase HTD2-like protein with hotdog domain
MRWSAAIENWHKIHYDVRYATEHDGLPGLLVNGTLKQQFLAQLLKDWARPEGWLWKLSFQFRAMNLVGETLSAWARVTATHRFADFGVIDLDVGLINGEGKESTPGTARVALPYRGGRAVPYPFVPPAE